MTRTGIILGVAALAIALLVEPAGAAALGTVSGMGVKMWGACVVCAGGGLVIALQGWGAILMASLASNSLGIAGACVGACIAALS